MESLPFLESIKNRIRIVHQTGKADYKKIKTSYQQTKIEFEANVFFDKMAEIYKNTRFIYLVCIGEGNI